MESNFWFYTLSAIPQTLAAVVALVATFSVFKISKNYDLMDKCIDSIKDYLYPLHPDKEIHDIENMDARDILQSLKEGVKKIHPKDVNYPAYDNLRDLFNNEIARRHRNFSATPERIYSFLEQKKDFLSKLIDNRKETIKYLGISFLLNTVTIGISLASLPNYSRLINYTWPLVCLIVLMSAASLIYTIYTAWRVAQF